MILTEEHIIRCRKNDMLFRQIDDYCYRAKNLYNSTNYLIRQCGRISRKLSEGEILDSWEKALIRKVNCALAEYNGKRKGKKPLAYVDERNSFIADVYFLSWHLKTSENYRAMPYATCAQICIQELCRDWKSYYAGAKAWKRGNPNMLGNPGQPGYRDPVTGRHELVITSQNFSVGPDGSIRMPGFLKGIHLHARHGSVRQIRIKTQDCVIRIQLMYSAEKEASASGTYCMGIDPGVTNLMTLCMNSDAQPVIIDGKGIKSMNQYYNKRKACLQSAARKSNGRKTTRRMEKLTQKRNRKIRDYMHKASRKVIEIARKENVGTIVFGLNPGRKQESTMGNITNQAFTAIPHRKLAEMIRYKGEIAGIRVIIIEENCTSGTSYLDHESPERKFYDKSRRISRGVFRSNGGIEINADVNAAYQIMKKAGFDATIKEREKVVRIKVS